MLTLLLLAASPQATTGQQAELFVGCPPGAVMETAPDPRPGPLSTLGVARLVVRCVTQRTLAAPQCAAGFRLLAGAGADRCGSSPTSGGAATASDGTSNTLALGEAPRPAGAQTRTDGTSNTLLLGEAARPAGTQTATDGSSNTVMVGERPAPVATTGKGRGAETAVPTPVCPAGGQLTIDGSSFGADACVTRSFAAPADPVPVTRR